MDDTPEVIRQQMEETKSQLTEKLESLESQVSETVQSTGTAVNATVESVQETFEAMTGAVHDAVQSVSNAFDLPRQVQRHPWIAFSGSFALGYVANEFLNAQTKDSNNGSGAKSRSSQSAVPSQYGNGHHAVEPVQQNSSKSLLGAELRGMLTGALMGAMSAIVSRGVPAALDYFAKSLRSDPNQDSVAGWEKPRSPK